mgnify:CR=1 FL=1
MNRRIALIMFFILFICFMIEFKHEFNRDYKTIVQEIRGWGWQSPLKK